MRSRVSARTCLGRLPGVGQVLPRLCPLYHLPPPHTHLEDRYHIRVGVEHKGGEFGVGAWPGQHSHHKARCHLERARRRGGQCSVSRCPRPPPRPSPRRAPGSPPLSDSPGPAGGLSPLGMPRQPLGTQSLEAASAYPGLPLARKSLGVHPERGADPEMGCCLLNTIPRSSETPAFLSPRKKIFLASDPLWRAKWEVQG